MGAVQIAKIKGSQYSGRAQGGPVKAGNIYPVNEAGTEGFQFRSGGKEYLQPMTDGKVVKNSDMKKGGGGDSFSISNSYTIQALDTTTAAQFIEQNQEAVYQSVINAANERGGF
jgi:SLT domain-containing protein